MKRGLSFLVLLGIYILAIAVGGVVFWLLFATLHPILNMFVADLIATIIVFAFSIILKNSSVYDPYWSVIPPIVVLVFVLTNGKAINVNDILILVAVFVWAVRLTANWAQTFKGLQFQDWRYTQYKTNYPKIWQLLNFGGIHFMPTLIVYLGTIPLYFVAQNSTEVLNIATLVGMLICVGATTLQLFADEQMHNFRQNNTDKNATINCGLWKYSRHPNYLAEISFWVGVTVMAIGYAPWYSMFGAVAMTILFTVVSIPLMEKHMLASSPSYADYKKQVSMILLLPRKKDKQ